MYSIVYERKGKSCPEISNSRPQEHKSTFSINGDINFNVHLKLIMDIFEQTKLALPK
jgi:hypothetical protein